MSVSPVGPRDFNFAGMPAGHFEEMCGLLVLLDYPEAQPTGDPDGGADVLLPKPGNAGGWVRAWQAKRFTGNISWSQCRQSLDDALANYQVEHVTFVFARDPTVGQLRNFETNLVNRHAGVRVDHWGKTKLLSLLSGSEQGERIAKRYFGANAPDPSETLRAVRAGGELQTAEQAAERGLAMSQIMNSANPHYAFTGVQFPDGVEPPITSGAVMSISLTEHGVTSRLDAIPRQAALGAIPPITVTVEFENSEAGRRAAAAFEAARLYRQPADITDGFTITTSGAPAEFQAFQDSVGPQMLRLVPDPPPPWDAIFETDTTLGKRRLEMTMYPATPEDGYQARFVGRHVGLTAAINVRAGGPTEGAFNFNWHHSVTDAPARSHLTTLRFLESLHGDGQLVLTHKPSNKPVDIRLHATDFPLGPVLALMEIVVQIEDWIGQDIVLPREVPTDDDLQLLAQASQMITTRTVYFDWEEPAALAPPDRIPSEPVALHLESALAIPLFGGTYPLGVAVLDVPEVDVTDLGPSDDDPSVHKITIKPVNGDFLEPVEWVLAKPRRG